MISRNTPEIKISLMKSNNLEISILTIPIFVGEPVSKPTNIEALNNLLYSERMDLMVVCTNISNTLIKAYIPAQLKRENWTQIKDFYPGSLMQTA